MLQLLDRPAFKAEKTDRDAPLDFDRDTAAELFRLLGDGTRLQIVRYLIEHGELHVTALCNLLDRSQPVVSHHLATLRLARIVAGDRRGKQNFYRITSARLGRLLRVAILTADERR